MVERRENVTDDIKMAAQLQVGYYKQSMSYRPLRFLDKMKETKLRWIYNLSKIKEEDLNNARCKSSRHFRIQTKGCPDTKFMRVNQTEQNEYIRCVKAQIDSRKANKW